MKEHKKLRELGAYFSQIGDMSQNFQKFPTLPDSLWIESENEDLPKPNEYAFRVQGGIVFKEACANIFKRFNLGNSTLTPIKIYRPNKELWRDETYYFLNLCKKRTFIRKVACRLG